MTPLPHGDLAQQLQDDVRLRFPLPEAEVESWPDGPAYHFRFHRVPQELHGDVCDWARDILSSYAPYRCEVQCN